MMRTVIAVTIADVRERIRRPAYLVVLLGTIVLACFAVPAPGSSWQIFQFGDYRGIYNSAWVGTVTALAGAVWLSLAGFYVVRGGIVRDEMTGVGEILATTPLRKSTYLFGKFLSNFVVLVSMVAVLAASALALQLWRGESRTIDLVALLAPFALIAVPVLAMTASSAVLLETVPGLRAGLGNLLWVVIWMFGAMAIQSTAGPFDVLGLKVITSSMQAAVPTTAGDTRAVEFGVGLIERDTPLAVVNWSGTSFGAGFIVSQVLVLVFAAGLTLLGAMWFNRFDPARETRMPGSDLGVEPDASPGDSPLVVKSKLAILSAMPAVHSLRPAGYAPSWLQLVFVETRILTGGMSRWWWAGAAGLSVFAAVVPAGNLAAVALPFAWIWPVVVWSRLGTQPAEHDIDDLLATCPGRWRQIAAVLMAGAVLSMAISGIVALRLLIAGDLAGIVAWTAGALVVPALAFCLGLLTRSPRPFQVIYLLIWYMVLNGAEDLDFMGAVRDDGALAGPGPLMIFAVSAGLIGLSVILAQLRHANR